jgi:hypothetical protein
LARLAAFAAFAETQVGPIPERVGDAPTLYPATSRGFALYCVQASPYFAEVAELLGRSKLIITAPDHVDAPHVMLIDVRKYWGTLGPISGDIVLFADGNAAVVTKALCMGCQHFEGVSLKVDGPPVIEKQVHWASTLKWIIRIVDESDAQPVLIGVDMASADVHAALNSEAATPDAAPPADGEPAAPTGRKRKLTAIG